MIAGHYRIAADPFQVAHDLGLGTRAATGDDIVRAANRLGLRCRVLRNQKLKRLADCPTPAIMRFKDGGYRILLLRLPDGRLRVGDPVSRIASEDPPDKVAEQWDGELIQVTRRWGGVGADPSTFSFSWFLPSIWRYRVPLSHVIIASFFIQAFALITPLFFQVVIDKVLVHKGMSTLVVMVVGLAAIGLFDVTLQFLRAYALNHTTSRIDVELGSRLFDHLLRLPLAYFETRPAG